MTDDRNTREVAIVPGDIRRWILDVPTAAQTFEEQRTEAVRLFLDVCECLSAVFRPTTVEYWVRTFDDPNTDTDPRLGAFSSDGTSMTSGTVDLTQTSAEQVMNSEIVEACATEECVVLHLEVRGKTKISLIDGDHWIDRTDTEYAKAYTRTGPVGDPDTDPLRIRIMYRTPIGADRAVENVGYSIYLWSETDIWAESTEIGNTNRERLEESFRALRDRLSIQRVTVSFEWNHELGYELGKVLWGSDEGLIDHSSY
jgi:hypothetical protein